MKVLILGELAYDISHICKCERLSPEAPVPVAIPIEKSENGGMALNVFNNINSLCENSIETFLIANKTPIIKTRYIDKASGQMMLRVDTNDIVRPEEKLTEYAFYQALKEANLSVGDFSAIAISDYAKEYLDYSIINFVIEIADMHKIPVFLDTKKQLNLISKKLFVAKINRKEYDFNCEKISSPESYVKNLIVTRAEDGAIWHKEDGSSEVFETNKIQVRNVSGCGDSFLSALVVNYLQTKDLSESIKYALKCATFAATQKGIVSVKKSDIV